MKAVVTDCEIINDLRERNKLNIGDVENINRYFLINFIETIILIDNIRINNLV